MSIKTRLVLSFIAMLVIPIILISLVFNSGISLFLNSNAIPRNSTTFSVGLTFSNQQNGPKIYSLLKDALFHPDRLEDPLYLTSFERKLKQEPIKAGIIVRKQNRIIHISPEFPKASIAKILPGFGDFARDMRVTDGQNVFKLSQYDFYFPNKIPGSVFTISDQVPAERTLLNIASILGISFILILIVTNGLLTFFVSRSIIKPLNSLKTAAEQIKSGDLNCRIGYYRKNELGQLAAAFEDMRAQLQDSLEKQRRYEKNRKELISGISHDLKTPITAIKGYVEGIIDGVADTPEKIKRYIQTIRAKADHLDRLVDELFLFSKLDLQKMPSHFEPVALRDYLQDCMDELRFDLEAKNISLRFKPQDYPQVVIIADREKLKRVIVNIIENAVKYMDETKEQRQISIQLQDLTENVLIRIEDNGQGINKEDLPLIFDRFYRADPARNSATGGSGLGLAIAKLIITEHGGTIWAESDSGEGTSICFTLRKEKNEKVVSG